MHFLVEFNRISVLDLYAQVGDSTGVYYPELVVLESMTAFMKAANPTTSPQHRQTALKAGLKRYPRKEHFDKSINASDEFLSAKETD